MDTLHQARVSKARKSTVGGRYEYCYITPSPDGTPPHYNSLVIPIDPKILEKMSTEGYDLFTLTAKQLSCLHEILAERAAEGGEWILTGVRVVEGTDTFGAIIRFRHDEELRESVVAGKDLSKGAFGSLRAAVQKEVPGGENLQLDKGEYGVSIEQAGGEEADRSEGSLSSRTLSSNAEASDSGNKAANSPNKPGMLAPNFGSFSIVASDSTTSASPKVFSGGSKPNPERDNVVKSAVVLPLPFPTNSRTLLDTPSAASDSRSFSPMTPIPFFFGQQPVSVPSSRNSIVNADFRNASFPDHERLVAGVTASKSASGSPAKPTLSASSSSTHVSGTAASTNVGTDQPVETSSGFGLFQSPTYNNTPPPPLPETSVITDVEPTLPWIPPFQRKKK